MSLYNMLFGMNPLTPILLAILDLDQKNGQWRTGRFRDIYYDKEKEKIILYTRNGGGNREHWDDEKEPGPDCMCTGCVIRHHLRRHPNYIRDWDDDFDCTYAYVEFSVPERFKDYLDELVTKSKIENVNEKFDRVLKKMQSMSSEEMKNDRQMKNVVEVFEKIFKKIDEVSHEKETD
jgi:hypothetical protein